MRVKVIAKAVIVNEAGEVLLLRRSATDDRRPGEWDFPGGGIEPGEGVTAGVIREIAEEAGLRFSVADLRLIYAATETYAENQESVTRLLFVGHNAGQAVRLSFEHDLFKWRDVETALTDFPHPFYGAGLAYARDHGLLA